MTCTHTLGKRGKVNTYASGQPAVFDLNPGAWRDNENPAQPILTVDYQNASTKARSILRDRSAAEFSDDLQGTLLELSRYIAYLEKESFSTRSEGPDPPSTSHAEITQTPGPDGILAHHLKLVSIDSSDNSRLRFYGKSSSIMLLKAALDFKKVTAFHAPRRPEFWDIYPWQVPNKSFPNLQFPEKDLMDHLIKLFFLNVNTFIPILHWQSFRNSVDADLHHQNYHFGALLCVVCAMASRYSTDSKVFYDEKYPEQSSGWQWFVQVQPVQPTSLVHPPSIYELQYYCLSALYLYGTSTSESSWAILGLAVRLAQDLGLHRRMGKRPSIDGEEWKRVFWAIAAFDVLSSVILGRPRAIQSEDFDQDLPIECDDEFWDVSDPAQAFKQPADRPSTIAYWNSYLKLLGILGMAQRTVYSIKRSVSYSQAATQLDSALDKWLEFVPEHLRWGTQHKDKIFENQSARLYTAYYFVRILVHSPGALSSQPMSLAICVKAARRCIDIMDQQVQKGLVPLLHMHTALFTSAVILVLDSWVTPSEAERHRADVVKCLNILRHDETRWQIAGRLSDLIQGLLQLEVPEGTGSPRPSKRKRQTQEPDPSLYPQDLPPDVQGFGSFIKPDLTSFPAELSNQPPSFPQSDFQGYPFDHNDSMAGWNVQQCGTSNSGTDYGGYWEYSDQPQSDWSLF